MKWEKGRDFFEIELREKIMVPIVVLAEYIEISGSRISAESVASAKR